MVVTVKKPIFIVSTGRSGSTIFHRLLAEHPRITYFTALLHRRPAQIFPHRLYFCFRGWPLLGQFLVRHIRPGEAWGFWDLWVTLSRTERAFSESYRDWRAEDVSPFMEKSLQEALPRLLSPRRPHLLTKFTGWTRIGFIKELFPDAKIIHFIREPQPTANSLLTIGFWRGWYGPGRWRWGPLTDRQNEVWHRYGQSFAVLAGITWIRIMEAYRESMERLPEALRGDVLEVRYEDLCSDKTSVMAKALDHCELESVPAFWKAMDRFRMRPADNKWKQDLSPIQKEQLGAALEALNWRQLYRP